MSTLSEPRPLADDDASAPMTVAQRHYLVSLCQELREPLPGDLTRDQADDLIALLQRRTGRGLGG